MFRGYVFCEFDLRDRLQVLTIPGVYHIVGTGNLPEPMDQDELLAIERFAASGLAMEPWTFLKTGQMVVVERGPLSGLKGLLVEVKDSQRLVISLSILQQSIAVEINRGDLLPLQVRVAAGESGGVTSGSLTSI